MTGHAVVIAGGGPTGLMLAGELALAGGNERSSARRSPARERLLAGGPGGGRGDFARWPNFLEP